MKNGLLLLFCLFTVTHAIAQAPAIQWQVSTGGSDEELPSNIVVCPDSSYLAMGFSTSHDGDVVGAAGPWNPWLVKISSTGTVLWRKCIVTDSNLHTANCMQPTHDGNYIFTGFAESSSGTSTMDLLVTKMNDTGGVIWQKIYGNYWGAEYGNSISPTTDGGYIVAASTNYPGGDVTAIVHIDSMHCCTRDVWILKLNSSGNIVWQRTIGGLENDEATSIKQTPDGGYIFAGHTESTDGDLSGVPSVGGFWVVKLSDTGAIQWQKEFPAYYAGAIELTSDSGYIATGTTESTTAGDCYIVKLDNSGGVQWQQTYGGSENDGAGTIKEIPGGGYIVQASTNSHDGDVTGYHGGGDMWIFRISSAGVLQWQKPMGGTASEGGGNMALAPDGGLIAFGTANSTDGDLTANQGHNDYWIVKLEAPSAVPDVEHAPAIFVTPNPTTDVANVHGISDAHILVYNAMGQVVKEVSGESISLSAFPAGAYFIKVFSRKGKLLFTSKVMKM